MKRIWLKRLDTYIISKFLGTYFVAILLTISIVIVFDYGENIEKFSQGGATLQQILFDYYPYYVPYFANMLSALLVFVSVIFFTSKMAGNSEVIAILSAGVSFRRFVRPYIIAATLIGALNFYLSSEVIPRSNVIRLEFENQYKNKKKNATYSDNMQMQVDSGVIVFVEHFDGPTKTGYHVSLDKFENKKLVSHLTANSITYDSINTERFHWKMHNVNIRELHGTKEKITHHQQLDSIIKMQPQDFLTIKDMQETMTNSELREHIQMQAIRGTGNDKPFEVEYHKRYASAFASFIMTLIGVSLSSRKRKGGMGFALGLGLTLSVLYIFLQGVTVGFATNADAPPMLAVWAPNILYTFISIYLYTKAPR